MPSTSLLSAAILLSLAALASGTSRGSLLWSDEFDGPAGAAPSESRWAFDEGDGSERNISGWGNQELQFYTREAARLDGSGHLVITATAAGAEGRRCYYGPCRFTSARLVSHFNGTFGRFEARVQTAEGAGTWPAFWMLGANIGQVRWPECGEIDVMEARGSDPSTVSGAAHGPGYSGGQALVHSYRTPNSTFADGFHIVALDWWPDSLAWSVDGVTFGTERKVEGRRWVFDHPFFMLLNLAVGGHFGGEPATDANFTAKFVVDYVRVYGHLDNRTQEDNRTVLASAVAEGGASSAVARSMSAWIVVVVIFALV